MVALGLAVAGRGHQGRMKTGWGRGVVLVFAAGILAILSALGVSFYALTSTQTKSAVLYSDAVRAEFMAQAGVQFAIARLREQAYVKPEDASDPWYTVDYLNGAAERISYPADLGAGKKASYSVAMSSALETNSDRFTLRISDASSKINVNAGDNLAVLLDNLCRVIGPPLVAANPKLLQPRRWGSTPIGEGGPASFDTNTDDLSTNRDLYYATGDDGRPVTEADGKAVYGDGYAVAAYRSRSGRFRRLVDVKNALTYVERSTPPDGAPNDPLEILEVEAKFAAIKDYLTINSWVDTNTVCVGKFEWASNDILIDRDKSWIASVDSAGNPIPDLKHERGTLRGCYLSIVNGHGAGQLRRIRENGTDWVQIEGTWSTGDSYLYPGPISSYMIVAREDALTEDVTTSAGVIKLPRQNADGTLMDDPDTDYAMHPLCIHRAPVNVNTASDKVLAALFMGVNVQHGHPMAIATDTDLAATQSAWKQPDARQYEPELLTWSGLKRLPVRGGELLFDRPMPTADPKFAYLNNFGLLDPGGTANVSEAQELAYRIITARQKADPAVASEIDPLTNFEKGPIRSWDDLYFRIIKPWDDSRPVTALPVARMLMALCNPNTDILKFNPNIEWIDRWGRNFTEMEPVMVFDKATHVPVWITWTKALGDTAMYSPADADAGKPAGAYYPRSMRYKSTDMIDKTDLNRSTTELGFGSNGIFEIQSVGEVVLTNMVNQVASQRRIDALVKVYDVWRETTQRQFVQGKFHAPAGMGTPGSMNSGQVSRDAYNAMDRMPLNTLPEPLVPLAYRLNSASVKELIDASAPDGRDVFGNGKMAGVPDVVANRILPAQYDGQIVLATNTSAGPNSGGSLGETFMAHFDGDLDTDDCKGNGREQAKVPNNRQIRVVDTIGLLGVLGGNQIDFDPKEIDPGAAKALTAGNFDTFATATSFGVYERLNEANYWENVTCRMGDLRSDGVYLGSVGVSGKDATLKYMWTSNADWRSVNGSTVSLWFKPTWHPKDNIEHEFFNATNPGKQAAAREGRLMKAGRYTYCGNNTVAIYKQYNNDLMMVCEDWADRDFLGILHGGTHKVPSNQTLLESPSFRTQPFRWGFVGGMVKYNITIASTVSTGSVGFWDADTPADLITRDDVVNLARRPFINSQRDPEGPANKDTYNTQYFHAGSSYTSIQNSDIGKQSLCWSWCDGANTTGCFGLNNLNDTKTAWLYRSTPLEGTQSVVDELKITNKWWSHDEIYAETTTSRYYLPPGLKTGLAPNDPANRALCPTFTSQTLLQSRKGFDKTTSSETVAVVRVSWSGFAPRFMHENKDLTDTRLEVVKGVATSMKFRGPFDYVQYNRELMQKQANEGTINPAKPFMGVIRPSPHDYPVNASGARQAHASRGLEVELIESDPVSAPMAPALASLTFSNPDLPNSYGDMTAVPRVKISDLRYRVRFLYPRDELVGGGNTVDPAAQYLLDTPVFDDISITYLGKVQYLDFQQVTE